MPKKIDPELLNDAYVDADDIGASIIAAAEARQRAIRNTSAPQAAPADERNTIVGGTVMRTHRKDACMGYWCPIHNTSLHHMRTWKQVFDPSTGVMLRECPHGGYHPDPDDPFEFAAAKAHKGHCDGCCAPATHIKRKQDTP